MISSILPAILPTVCKLVDKIFPNEQANKREKFKIEQELVLGTAIVESGLIFIRQWATAQRNVKINVGKEMGKAMARALRSAK